MADEGSGMKRLWREMRCSLFGHPDTRLCWGRWQDDPELGRYRVVTERCARCDGVLNLASVIEGGRWTA